MNYTYQHNGQKYTIQVEAQTNGRYTITVGDHRYNVQAVALPNEGWRLELQPASQEDASPPHGAKARYTVYTAAQGDKRFISLGGQDYTLAMPDSRASRRRTSVGSGDLTAQMPGQVVNVLVSEGDTVERGQTLVILEAMKMEIRVAAPDDGRVKRLLVEKGQIVERGQRLLEIE
jgi:biotin carboxyl carrier protein